MSELFEKNIHISPTEPARNRVAGNHELKFDPK